MIYKPVKDVAEEWGLTVRRVQMMCMDGTIRGAVKEGKLWMVPDNAVKPEDKRVISGAYKKNNTKANQTGKLYITDKGVDKKFYFALSHDIRTSLSSILGYSDMIKAHIDEPNTILDYINNITDAGNNIVRMLENTSMLSRIDGKEIQNDEKVFSNTAVLHNVIDNFRQKAENKNIVLNKEFLVKHEFIFADEEKFTIIIENILDILIQFSKQKSKIKIKASEYASSRKGYSKYIYTLEDNTEVFNTSQINFIRECSNNKINVFANNSHTNMLGLIITQKLTSLMDGSFEIRNDNTNGTVVKLTFEQQLADLSSVNTNNDNSIDYDFLKGKTVLLADDNEINRNMAGKILNEHGINVEFAEDGIICIAMLEKAEAKKYDCILMDIQMPNMNGLVASSIIRDLPDKEKASIPIIAVTASVFKDDREKALKAGMNGFVEKPFQISKLFSVISNILENR